MTPEQSAKFDEVGKRLQEAVDKRTAEGHVIQSGDWGLAVDHDVEGLPVYVVDPDDCLCPMACILIGEKSTSNFFDPEHDCSRILGIGEYQVSNFVVGFDHAELTATDYVEDEYYHLGRAFRAKLVG